MALDIPFTILYRKKMFLYLITYGGLMLSFLYFADSTYKNASLSILILGALILPFFFINFLKKYFTARGLLKINPQGLLVELKNLNGIQEIDLAFQDIRYYKIYFPTTDFYVIDFILNDNKNIEFSFIDFDKENNATASSEIISVLNKSIKDYNNTPGARKILYKHSFIASKKGLITLAAIVVLIFISITLHIITRQYQTIPVSLFGGFLLLIQFSSQRKIDLNYYKEHIADGQS